MKMAHEREVPPRGNVVYSWHVLAQPPCYERNENTDRSMLTGSLSDPISGPLQTGRVLSHSTPLCQLASCVTDVYGRARRHTINFPAVTDLMDATIQLLT